MPLPLLPILTLPVWWLYKPDTEHMAGCEVLPVYLPYRAFFHSYILPDFLCITLPDYYDFWFPGFAPLLCLPDLDWCLCICPLPAYWLSSFGLPLCMSTDWTVTLVLTLCLTSCFCLLQILLINFCEWILVLPQRRPYISTFTYIHYEVLNENAIETSYM